MGKMKASTEKDYPALRAWNLYLSGPESFSVDKAHLLQAPDNVIYFGVDVPVKEGSTRKQYDGNAYRTLDDLPVDHDFRTFYAQKLKEWGM